VALVQPVQAIRLYTTQVAKCSSGNWKRRPWGGW